MDSQYPSTDYWKDLTKWIALEAFLTKSKLMNHMAMIYQWESPSGSLAVCFIELPEDPGLGPYYLKSVALW